MRKKKRSRQITTHNIIRNSHFGAGLANWDNMSVSVLGEMEGDQGSGAACLEGSRAFLSQTRAAKPWDKLELVIRLRGQSHLANSPVVVRVRWADFSGNFLSPDMTIFIPRKHLTASSWNEYTIKSAPAPRGTTRVDIRIDAPLARKGAGIIIKQIELHRI